MISTLDELRVVSHSPVRCFAKSDAKLKFSLRNAKLTEKGMAIFSLPAGFTCPAANICLAYAHRTTGKITDGKNASVRCFAASGEARSTEARKAHWHNLDLLQACSSTLEMADLIERSLPKSAQLVRIHASGDYYKPEYFDAWIMVACRMPHIKFYAYTKQILLWLERRDRIPSNMILTASYGGKHDAWIAPNKLKSAIIVNYPHEATALGLTIDHDDSNAWQHSNSFALLIHGTQRKGSAAQAAWNVQRAEKRALKLAKLAKHV